MTHAYAQRLGLVLCLLLAPAAVSAEEPDEAQIELGKRVFVEIAEPQCGMCHTLADAEADGTIAPSLDDLQPTKEQVQAALRQAPGVMPAYGNFMSDEHIEAVSAYVAHVAGQP